jgi:hypothetical protein
MRFGVVALLSSCTCVFALACGGSFPPPNDQWSQAKEDVGRAAGGGATQVPDAKLHLQLAQEDLDKGKQLIDQDNKRAASFIALARVEAQLALSLARQQAAQDAAQSTQSELQKAKGGQ